MILDMKEKAMLVLMTKPEKELGKEGSIMANTSVIMKIDENLNRELKDLMQDLGLDLNTFFTIVARQAVREQAIPFYVSREIPNEETIAAFKEVEEMRQHPEKIKSYDSFAELLQEVEDV